MPPLPHFTRLKILLRRIIPLCLIAGLVSIVLSCSPSPRKLEDTLSAPPIQTPLLAPTLQGDSFKASAQSVNPNGILVADDQNGEWAWVDMSGSQIMNMDIPPGLASDPASIHISGRFSGAERFPAVIAHAWLPQPSIVSLSDGQVRVLHATDQFLAMVGVPGQPLIAFSEIVYQDGAGDAILSAGYPMNLKQAVGLTDLADGMPGFAPLPLAVESVQGAPGTVWYSLSAWDTRGAEILFPISLGLFKANLISGESQPLLGLDRNLQGLSPDRSLAASVAAGLDKEHSLYLHHLDSGRESRFNLKPGYSGAGFAVFSPHNRSVAWLEAGGAALSENGAIFLAVRVARLSGAEIVTDLDLGEASRAVEFTPVVRMRPIGWLDEDQLLVEVSGAARQQTALVRMDISAGMISFFSPGRFLAFTYP